jgi:hypothetical protein
MNPNLNYLTYLSLPTLTNFPNKLPKVIFSPLSQQIPCFSSSNRHTKILITVSSIRNRIHLVNRILTCLCKQSTSLKITIWIIVKYFNKEFNPLHLRMGTVILYLLHHLAALLSALDPMLLHLWIHINSSSTLHTLLIPRHTLKQLLTLRVLQQPFRI